MHGCLNIYVRAFQSLFYLLFIARNQFLSNNVSIQCIFGRKFEYLQIVRFQRNYPAKPAESFCETTPKTVENETEIN